MGKSYRKSRRKFVNVRLPLTSARLILAQAGCSKGRPIRPSERRRSIESFVLDALCSYSAGFISCWLWDIVCSNPEWTIDRCLKYYSGLPSFSEVEAITFLTPGGYDVRHLPGCKCGLVGCGADAE